MTLMKLTPAMRSTEPNVSRAAPVSGFWPIRDAINPIHVAITPLRSARPERLIVKREAHEHERKIFRRAEGEGEPGKNGGEEGQAHKAQGAGHEGRDGGNGERRPGPSLPGHLVTVYRRRHRRGFAGNVDHDCRRRPAVHGSIVDGRHHDDARGGRQYGRKGEQYGDP